MERKAAGCSAHRRVRTAGRAIEEWAGDRWVAVGVVEDLAAAKSLLSVPRSAGRDKGRGRQREPDPTDEDR
ncbi:DUF6087 family protein [Streptomyces sp. NPDC058595]|uniref:DUF6087 family protein n=1 Tax=Streptomyces sp. NPDC058595 TaxID=3346550 RepID=UPI003655CF4D